MSITNRVRLHTVIDARLSSIARSSPQAPTWYEYWQLLGPSSTVEERLLVCQTIRDSGTLPAEAGDFLVSLMIEDLTIEVESELEDGLQTMNQREGRRSSDRMFADLLDKHGQHEMADRFRTDPLCHAERRETGRQFFFGVGEPEIEDSGWLMDFIETISSSLITEQPPGKLGSWYREEGGYWEISVFPVPAGGVGDKLTQAVGPANLAWDIHRLQSAFDRVDGVGWYAACPAETGSPYVWLEGEYQDHDVFLRLLPGEPDQVEHGEKRGL